MAARARSSIAGSLSTADDLVPGRGQGHRQAPGARGQLEHGTAGSVGHAPGTGPGRPGRPRGRGRSSGRAVARSSGPSAGSATPELAPGGLDQRRVGEQVPGRLGNERRGEQRDLVGARATPPHPGTRSSGRACPRRDRDAGMDGRAATWLTLPMSGRPASWDRVPDPRSPPATMLAPNSRARIVRCCASWSSHPRTTTVALAVGGQRGGPDQVLEAPLMLVVGRPGRGCGS